MSTAVDDLAAWLAPRAATVMDARKEAFIASAGNAVRRGVAREMWPTLVREVHPACAALIQLFADEISSVNGADVLTVLAQRAKESGR